VSRGTSPDCWKDKKVFLVNKTNKCTEFQFYWYYDYMFWAERLPEKCRVITPIKSEFSASVGFIHKESVTMCSHTIVKYKKVCLLTIIHNEEGNAPNLCASKVTIKIWILWMWVIWQIVMSFSVQHGNWQSNCFCGWNGYDTI
jgi:hypothetical protein